MASANDKLASVFNKFYRLILEIKRLASKIGNKVDLDLNLSMTDNILVAVRIFFKLGENETPFKTP